MTEKIMIPREDGKYIRIYKPQPDVYLGPDTLSFSNGKTYSDWITNDFSIINENGEWHITGITHPRPIGFYSAFDFRDETVHEAEYQLFHCTAKGESFKDLFYEDSFSDNEKILYPKQRNDGINEIWAPHLMKHDEKYKIIYSPGKIRCASSEDFKSWETNELFECEKPYGRDPYVYFDGERYIILYIDNTDVYYRTSYDMKIFSKAEILQKYPFSHGSAESPFLMKREGMYYLFWCIHDGTNSCYDNRTFVFAGKTIESFSQNYAPLNILFAHAPEFICDSDGTYYMLSVFYPENGISAIKLKWE